MQSHACTYIQVHCGGGISLLCFITTTGMEIVYAQLCCNNYCHVCMNVHAAFQCKKNTKMHVEVDNYI